MIVVFASAQARRERPTAVPTWIFVSGYLLVWVATGAVVYPRPSRQRHRQPPFLDRPSQFGAASARGHTGRSRALSVHADQTRLPDPLPLAPCPRGAILARSMARGISDGYTTRGLLSWMLLGTLCGAHRRWGHEPGLDAFAHAGCLCRKGAPPRAAHFKCDLCRIRRPRARGRQWCRPNALERVRVSPKGARPSFRPAKAGRSGNCRWRLMTTRRLRDVRFHGHDNPSGETC
jgi:hypothetical protein